MNKGKGFGAVVNGIIDVATVSPTEIAAKVNFLVVRLNLVVGQIRDSEVNMLFEKHCPDNVEIKELDVVPSGSVVIDPNDEKVLWELAAALYPNVFDRPVKTSPVVDKNGKVTGHRLEESVGLNDPLIQEAFVRVKDALKRASSVVDEDEGA